MDPIIHNIIETVEHHKSNQEFDKARQVVEQAIIKYSGDYRLYEELADILLYAGDIPKAKKAIHYAQEIKPESPTGLYLMGYIATLDDDFSLAVDYLEKSNEYSPNNPEVLRNLGWSYTMMGQVRKGIVLLERALELNPDDQLIMEDLGMALLNEGNMIEARSLLKKIGKEHKISEVS